MEGAYTNFGEFEFSGGVYGTGETEIDAVSVTAVGMIPLGTSGADLFGSAGLSILSIDSSSATLITDDTGAGFVLGVGVSFSPIENLSLFAETQSHIFVLEVDTGFGTEEYTQAASTSHIGIKLTF